MLLIAQCSCYHLWVLLFLNSPAKPWFVVVVKEFRCLRRCLGLWVCWQQQTTTTKHRFAECASLWHCTFAIADLLTRTCWRHTFCKAVFMTFGLQQKLKKRIAECTSSTCSCKQISNSKRGGLRFCSSHWANRARYFPCPEEVSQQPGLQRVLLSTEKTLAFSWVFSDDSKSTVSPTLVCYAHFSILISASTERFCLTFPSTHL